MISNNLKELDETILEIERQIKSEPDPFLESVLERLKVIKSNSFPHMYERALQEAERTRVTKGGFRGYGVS